VSAEERQSVIAGALRGNFSGWQGLPEGTQPEELAALSDGEGPSGRGRLAGIPVRFQDYTGHPGLLRTWLDDEGAVFLVWVDRPELDRDSAEVLSELGPPDARLESAPSRIPATVQWVWGARGVTAYVAPDESIKGFALFAPAPVDYYEAWLGGHEGVPYRPYR
jgi:hypothetical protein